MQTIITALNENKLELACYLALIYNRSSGCTKMDNGDKEYTVCLDDAYEDVSSTLTKRQWSGYLSALTEKGLYKPTCKDFGEVVEKSL